MNKMKNTKKVKKMDELDGIKIKCKRLGDMIRVDWELPMEIAAKLIRRCEERGLRYPEGVSILLKEVAQPCEKVAKGKAKKPTQRLYFFPPKG